MKKILVLCLSVITFNTYSQDYMEKIAIQTCDCISKVSDTTNTQKMYMELGVCMINASTPYKKQLKKDHDIDLTNFEKDAESLGKLVGLKMATVCPDNLMKLSKMSNRESKSTKESLVFTGRVTKIDREGFVSFSVIDEIGKTQTFYWLTFAESNIELASNYRTLIENMVKIKYVTKEFFDPRIGEYRNFNIIEKIEKR